MVTIKSGKHYFDLADTIRMLREFGIVSGIQRVVMEVWSALPAAGLSDAVAIGFHGPTRTYRYLDLVKIAQIPKLLALPNAREQVQHIARELLIELEANDAVTFTPGDTLYILGSPWHHEVYYQAVAGFKRSGLKVVSLVYDLIPIQDDSFPEKHCIEFKTYIDQLAMVSDRVATISQASRDALNEYCAEAGVPIPEGAVTKLPSGLVADSKLLEAVAQENDAVWPRPFVLIVGTIEARKQHVVAVRAWKHLIDELGPDGTPDLLCVGRLGWNAFDFIDELYGDSRLLEKVHLLTDHISDAQLLRMYQESLFTVYPSRIEGWGLPVSESLAFGKVAITTDVSSLPEAGGDLALYFKVGDHKQLAEIALNLIQKPDMRQELEAKIRANSDPITWVHVAEVILNEGVQANQNARDNSIVELPVWQEHTLRKMGTIDPTHQVKIYRDALLAVRMMPMTSTLMNEAIQARSGLVVQTDHPKWTFGGMCPNFVLGKSQIDFSFRRCSDDQLSYLISLRATRGRYTYETRVNGEKIESGALKSGLLEVPLGVGNTHDEVHVSLSIKCTKMFGRNARKVQLVSHMVASSATSQDREKISQIESRLVGPNGTLKQLPLPKSDLQKLRDMRNSFSWRITAPIRWLHSKITGRK